MQALNHTDGLRTNRQWAGWYRLLRFLAVGRNLFLCAALALVLSHWILEADTFGWLNGFGIFSGASYGILTCWRVGIVVLTLLDARSRFQDYKRIKDLLYANGFKPRIAQIYMRSKCQRDAARVAAMDLGLLEQLDCFYKSQGYYWYHVFPDILSKKPRIVFARRYWRKILFEPQYTSIHFLW